MSPENTAALWYVCVCVFACVEPGCLFSSWVRPRLPPSLRYSSPHHNWAGGPHKHALNMLSFFARLMSANIKKGRKNVWQGGKRWNYSSKQPQRIYLTEGERQARGAETRDERRSGWEYKYVHMKPHYSHVNSHYLLISGAAGRRLPVMTSILQISSCSQTEFVWVVSAESVPHDTQTPALSWRHTGDGGTSGPPHSQH